MTQIQEAPARARLWPASAQVVRVLLVLGWVLLAGLTLTLGARDASFGDLEEAVAAGAVDEVVVDGGLAPGSRGYATVRVTWRDGLLADTTQVVETSPLRRHDQAPGVTAVIGTSVAERLRTLDPDVRVRVDPDSSMTGSIGGWTTPGWSATPVALVGLATLLFVLASPPPVHCTRWAGFWLFVAGPIGLAAFLALVGPLRGLPDRWRLTGSWAFVGAVVLREVSGW